ncbi:hypothetical protein MNBD_GAMMA07-900 [hydrothermal vent metagenome]|uniref:Uncharacterized protein n=1 Tax=hydrothermal vent metagenome TaxID=652676 RepID=A0A3B0X3N9_9ZZZZ
MAVLAIVSFLPRLIKKFRKEEVLDASDEKNS